MFTYIKLAARNIIKQKKRSLLLGIAIASGVMIINIAGSFSNGVGKNILRSGTTLKTGHLNVTGQWKKRKTIHTRILNKSKMLTIIKKSIPGIKRIQERFAIRGQLFNPNRELGVQMGFVSGIDINNEPGFKENMELISGNLDTLQQPNKALIFKKLADKLFLKIGDTVSVKAKVFTKKYGNTTGTIDLTVGAIAKNMMSGGMNRLYASTETMRTFLGYESGDSGKLLIYLHNAKKINDSRKRLFKALDKEYIILPETKGGMMGHMMKMMGVKGWKDGMRLRISTMVDELKSQMQFKRVTDWISGLLILILGVIVFAGISNTLWMAIRERTNEVGTLRAIGMHRKSVLTMFIIEGLLIGSFAALVGSIAGIGVSWLLNIIGISSNAQMIASFLYKGNFTFIVFGTEILRIILLTVFVTGLASIIPGAKAAHMKPINAINHIG